MVFIILGVLFALIIVIKDVSSEYYLTKAGIAYISFSTLFLGGLSGLLVSLIFSMETYLKVDQYSIKVGDKHQEVVETKLAKTEALVNYFALDLDYLTGSKNTKHFTDVSEVLDVQTKSTNN